MQVMGKTDGKKAKHNRETKDGPLEEICPRARVLQYD